MKKLILIAAITISSSLSIAQNLLLMNPSFEGQSQAHIMPAPWIPCFDGGSPDTQPGQWGVNLQASHGNTYAAFLLEPNSTYQEGASIQLTSCLYASVEYTLSVDLAFAPVFNTAEPGSCYGSFAIWGGTGGCGKNELLAYTGPIYDTTWNTYTFNFTPTQDWCYISIGPILSDTCTGYINCLS
ncbi:MAG: hypothetical protein M0D57_10305 [Sphingobacteriales bacterium JAD_PAG50586_3]|nr:MAG: hypothetical protein M0D57_10305 [Sphingobacteriales bacterium JAD_PAG50586_3]